MVTVSIGRSRIWRAKRFVIGDPGQCLQTLLSWRQATGANHFLFRVHYAGMSAETAAD